MYVHIVFAIKYDVYVHPYKILPAFYHLVLSGTTAFVQYDWLLINTVILATYVSFVW